jgi:hypothetical protein
VASLGRVLMRTYVLAPLAWLMLALPYFIKVVPGLARRYTLTNRRVMIRRGMRPAPAKEVALGDIDEVRITQDANSAFFGSATLEIVSKGQVALALPGVKGPEAFRQAILNAQRAWAPRQAPAAEFIPASETKPA